MDKPKPAMVAMEMELEEDRKLPTMAEAIARFDQLEGVPRKKVPPAEIQQGGLSSAPVPPFQPKDKAYIEAPVEVIPENIVPPAKTLAAALTPFVPFVQPEKAAPGVKSPSPRLLILLSF